MRGWSPSSIRLQSVRGILCHARAMSRNGKVSTVDNFADTRWIKDIDKMRLASKPVGLPAIASQELVRQLARMPTDAVVAGRPRAGATGVRAVRERVWEGRGGEE